MAVGFLRLGEEILDFGFVGDIRTDGDGFAASPGDLFDDDVRAFFAGGVMDDDRGALSGEFLRDSISEPLEAPVTTATLPSSFFIMFLLLRMDVGGRREGYSIQRVIGTM